MITCEGCGMSLDNYDSLRKQWMEVSTERPHICPNPEKLKAALKKRRSSSHATDRNVQYIEAITRCPKCYAKYSVRLKECPNCHEQFIKSLFSGKKI